MWLCPHWHFPGLCGSDRISQSLPWINPFLTKSARIGHWEQAGGEVHVATWMNDPMSRLTLVPLKCSLANSHLFRLFLENFKKYFCAGQQFWVGDHCSALPRIYGRQQETPGNALPSAPQALHSPGSSPPFTVKGVPLPAHDVTTRAV